MDHDELIRRFRTDPDTLSPEARARMDAAREHTDRKIANGEFSARRTAGDDFAIGLDSNYEPFPVHNRETEDATSAAQLTDTEQPAEAESGTQEGDA